jgi:glycosyltransferase involved in cell wall biosynthesis
MVIGIDARAAAEVPAGRGRVVRELLRALAQGAGCQHSYVLYARERWGELPADDRLRWSLIAAGDPWWHVRAARAANRECDVFLSSNSYLTVWFLRIPTVAIVYDMVAFEQGMGANRRSVAVERATISPAIRRAARLVAISEATREALLARFPRAAERTVVAPLGVSPQLASVDSEEGLPAAGFVLAVGTLEPRKNLPRLVAAYQRLDRALQEQHPLVVVGARGWQTGETLDAVRSLGERAVLLGYVSDGVLAELYRRCAVFCYPSLGEGFGLPVLEAMAAGAPVLTSDLSSLPEVGGDAVAYADPRDVGAIAAALDGLLRSPQRREALAQAGRQRARLFTWEAFATRTLGALEEAGGGG